MKHNLLQVSFCVVILCWIGSPLGWLWILLVTLYYAYKKRTIVLYVMLLMLVFQCRMYKEEQEPPPENFIAQVEEIKASYVIAKTADQSILLYDVSDVSYGDIVQVRGTNQKITGLKNFHQFNFSKWASKRNIDYGCNVTSYEVLEKSTSIRSKLYERVLSLEEEPRTWILQSIYGIQEKDQDISFFVGASGMHLSFLAHLMQSILMLWMPTYGASAIALASISLLGFVSIMKDSLWRILIFRGVSFVCPHVSSKDRLGISILVFLMAMPYLADEFVFVLPVMFRLIFLFNIQKRKRYILSFLVLIPIQFFYFQQVDILQILLFSFLRVAYAMQYIMALCYLVIPIPWFFQMAFYVNLCLTYLTTWNWIYYYAASLPFVGIWFYSAFHYIGRGHKKDVMMLCCLCVFTQIAPYLRPYMEILMIDVGQGDCFLISLAFNQGNILIDVAGSPHRDVAKEVIEPVLRSKGIHALDLVIITHDDFDHSGGLSQLQEAMEVKQVIREKQEAVEIGNVTFAFLLPEMQYEDVNENSLLTFFEAYGVRFLFMGDAGELVEREVLKQYPYLEADILKLGHHGSKTSTSLPFLHQIHPQIGLLSCGANNFYGHPSPITMKSLENENVYALDTPTQGAVSIKLTTFVRFYKTAENEFGIIKSSR